MKQIVLLFLAGVMIRGSHAQISGTVQQREDQAGRILYTAEEYFRKDSIKLALYGNKNNPGFIAIINSYNGTQAANLASFYAGTCYLKLDDYRNAIKYLLNFSSGSKLIQARAYKLLADAYGDEGVNDSALYYYKKAAQFAEESPAQAAESLFSAAYLADRVMKNVPEARRLFKELQEKFPGTAEAKEAARFLAQYDDEKIIPGAERIDVYLPWLKGRRIGIFANPTSMVGNTHLVDTLRKLGVDIRVIFGPEHGFRGTADAGEKVSNYTDTKTGIPVISLYGSKQAPTAADLKNVDILVFDIQDVGVRFYTYISSLQDFMEAAFENSKPLLLLDRPNPNGFYVDGPVLDLKYKSHIGMQPIPVVYGMTMAEYAFMIAGEKWLSQKANEKYDYYRTAQNSVDTPFHFQVIKCRNYTHKSKYVLPVRPSPNLPEIQSIYLYPSTCFFEGTVLSEGRGTPRPFQVFGHPSLPKNLYAFTPRPNEGAKSSKHYGKTCYGWNLHGTPAKVLDEVDNKIQLKWLMEAYRLFPEKDSFFILPKSGKMEESFFNKLAGNNELWQQVKAGRSEEEIRKSWEPGLNTFKKIRKKYLLYEDFE